MRVRRSALRKDEALAQTMERHPHFMMPESTIEIVEIMPVPGM